jgi:hypothetical protein
MVESQSIAAVLSALDDAFDGWTPSPSSAPLADVAPGDDAAADSASAAATAAARSMRWKTMAKYAFDQSSSGKFVSLYLDLPAVEALPAGSVTAALSRGGTRLTIAVVGAGDENWRLTIPTLCRPCDGAPRVKVYEGRFTVRLRKRDAGAEWSDLTGDTDRKEAARKARMKEMGKGASTQELLADMYAHADDATRASLMTAAQTGRDKREGRAP